jgi:hypothetical protein
MKWSHITLFSLGFLCSSLHAADLSDVDRSCLARSHRSETNGWIYLHIEGIPANRGFQHGYNLASEIAEEIRVRKVMWKYESSMEWPWLIERAQKMFAEKIDPEALQEIDGISRGMNAAGFSTTRDELIAYNAFFELDWYWWPKELKRIKDHTKSPEKQACSSFIATGSMTTDGGIVLGHDTFFGYPLATARVIIDIAPEHGHRILMQTYPGWIHSGTDFFITDAGLVGSETTIGGFSSFDENGVPEFARFRRATQYANSLDEWCAIMRDGNNGAYANAWLLGDIRSGEIARLELGLKQVAFEKKTDGYFIGSNVAEDLKVLRLETDGNEVSIHNSSVARRVRWKQLMAEKKGKIDANAAKKLLADHYDVYAKKISPSHRTLCGHSEFDPAENGGTPFSPGGCFDGKIVTTALAHEMKFLARWGSACGTPFNAHDFLAAHPQFDWMDGILKDRPRQPWTEFAISR